MASEVVGRMSDEGKLTTVGEMRRRLAQWGDNVPLFFGDGGSNTLTLYRLRDRGSRQEPLVQVEFNELFEIAGNESVGRWVNL